MLRSNWMLIKNANQIKLNRIISLIKLIQIRNRLQLINNIQKTIWINKQKKYFKSVNYKRNNINNYPILQKIEEKSNEVTSKMENILDENETDNVIIPILQIDNKEEDFQTDINTNIDKQESSDKKSSDKKSSDKEIDKKMGFITKLALHLKEQHKQNYPYPLTIKYL